MSDTQYRLIPFDINKATNDNVVFSDGSRIAHYQVLNDGNTEYNIIVRRLGVIPYDTYNGKGIPWDRRLYELRLKEEIPPLEVKYANMYKDGSLGTFRDSIEACELCKATASCGILKRTFDPNTFKFEFEVINT